MRQIYTMDLSDRRLRTNDRTLCLGPRVCFGNIVSSGFSLPLSDVEASYKPAFGFTRRR